MKLSSMKMSLSRRIIVCVLLLVIVGFPIVAVAPRIHIFTEAYYTEQTYKSLEKLFNNSQYRQKNNPGIIPDETVFSYAAGAYLRGVDPILINSEHTPLGKYFLAVSIFLFRNDKTIILLFAALSAVSIWLVAKKVFEDSLVAMLPVMLVVSETLFHNQLVTVPLLDIIQLPFIYFTFAAFFFERKKGRFFLTAISIGCVMATKTIVPGILLIGCIVLLLSIRQEWKAIRNFIVWLSVAFMVFMMSYTRTFMSGYSLWEFLKFQKWIFLYQKSKLIYPFSSFRLLFFNQWQTWWGSFAVIRADDWNILWPLSTVASVIAGVWVGIRVRWKNPAHDPMILILLWVIAYQGLLSLGVVSSRFFIPLLPAQYILLVYVIVLLRKSIVLRKKR